MAEITKTLDLFRHSDKTPDGKHISYQGMELANGIGGNYDTPVHHVFCGPLVRTRETLVAMMVLNTGFENAEIHEPIDGLGSDELFKSLVTDEARTAIKGGKSSMEGVLDNCDERVLADFENGARDALKQMFGLMADDQHGVGIFHDPTVPMLAKFLGMEDTRSLESMEAIRFTLDEEGEITASWIE